jgi:exodeoxyribonuclease V gamma subunit
MMQVFWSNNLDRLAEKLADGLDGELAGNAAGVFAKEHCVLVPNNILQLWFQQHFLYERKAAGLRVLANIKYPLLHEFVNDWLFWMKHRNEKRDAAAHPFSIKALQWRIYRLLLDQSNQNGAYRDLRDYIARAGDDLSARRRAFGLAGRLAKLFDEYQVFRPDMMQAWRYGRDGGLDAKNIWQKLLWQEITDGREGETYLQSFLDMEELLPNCGIAQRCHAVHVFGVSMMPQVYVEFFRLLSESLPVKLYLFNPCQNHWCDAVSGKEQARRELMLAAREDNDEVLEYPNRFLADMGRGCRNFLGQILDVTGGQVEDCFEENLPDSLLGVMQGAVLNNIPCPEDALIHKDRSIQIHNCHSPMREMEILRDHIYKWCAQDESMQPRHIQVLVTDMATYAPCIDAVFASDKANAEGAVPYAIADRGSAGQSAAFAAFDQILGLPESRFSAREIMELLEFESVHQRFGIDEHELKTAVRLVAESGIRWGVDREHRARTSGADFEEQTSWRHGLDRLLLGYALTKDFEDEGLPLPCDMVEDETALLLGKLARYFDELQSAAAELAHPRAPSGWSKCLKTLIERFFATTENSYMHIGALYRAVEQLETSSAAADFEQEIPIAVVREFCAANLPTPGLRDSMNGNKLIFSALRSGAAAPRRVTCLLGLGDGQFPRSGRRAAYDILREGSRFGDPSLKNEDRAAFLEAFMAARERLHISYVGQSIRENESIPPATVVAELLEYAASCLGADCVSTVEHKLHPFNPKYFTPGEESFFSYDADNLAAAKVVAGVEGSVARSTAALSEQDADREERDPDGRFIELDELLRFFRNPARYFYSRVLGARLEDRDDVRLADEEEFDPKAIVGWKVNDALVKAQREAKSRDDARRELLEGGLLPLGQWGRNWFEQRWDAVAYLLAKVPAGENSSVLELLRSQEPLGEDQLQISIKGRGTLSGMAAGIATDDGALKGLDFRCGSQKAHHDLACWIRHLFVCASGRTETRIALQQALTEKNAKQRNFCPLDPAVAGGMLGDVLDIYATGIKRCLPFSTEASFAYAQKSDDADEARASAQQKWYSDDYSFKEDRDPYNLAAFGPDGPFDDPDFAKTASKLYEPLLEHSDELKCRRGKG